MRRGYRNWIEDLEACVRAVRTYFRDNGNPISVDEKELRKYLKEGGHGDPVAEIALSGIYFHL